MKLNMAHTKRICYVLAFSALRAGDLRHQEQDGLVVALYKHW